MTQPKDVTVELFAGVPREGIWCEVCQTWARYEVDVLTMNESGVNRAAIVEACDHCADDVTS